MEANVSYRFSKPAYLVGPMISLAMVCGGSVAFAERITGMPSSTDEPIVSYGVFSDADIAQLEQASTAELTSVRLASMGVATDATLQARMRSAAPAESSQVEKDLFRHSGQLMPLIVARPDSAPAAVRTTAGLRPGVVQPVGVQVSSLRSPTPSERASR